MHILTRARRKLSRLIYKEPPKPHPQKTTLGKRLKLSKFVHAVSGQWGMFFVLANDTVLPGEIEARGVWAAPDIEIFKSVVRPGDLVLDVGANIGHHSVVFSKLVGSEGRVLSIEAQRPIFSLLSATLVANGCENATALHVAAGEVAGSIKMYPVSYAGPGNYAALAVDRLNANQGGEVVEARTIDEIVASNGQGRAVSFVKMDIQASEFFALKGMEKTIRRDHPAIFFEIAPKWMKRAGYDYREIYRWLAQFGYSFEHRHPTLPKDAAGIPNLDFDNEIEWDVLAMVRRA